MKRLSVIIAIALLLASCKTTQQPVESIVVTAHPEQSLVGGVAALPPIVIYKTVGDYDNLVPVTMDESRTRIVSYPAPTDLKRNGSLSTPAHLIDGYRRDLRGININTVFTDYTYEEYSSFETAPTIKEILKHIKHTNPFTEFYIIKRANGANISNDSLNSIIKNGFKGCEIVKSVPNSTPE